MRVGAGSTGNTDDRGWDDVRTRLVPLVLGSTTANTAQGRDYARDPWRGLLTLPYLPSTLQRKSSDTANENDPMGGGIRLNKRLPGSRIPKGGGIGALWKEKPLCDQLSRMTLAPLHSFKLEPLRLAPCCLFDCQFAFMQCSAIKNTCALKHTDYLRLLTVLTVPSPAALVANLPSIA